MKLKDTIEHKGIIKDIVGTNVKVEIIKTSACSFCDSKEICSISENATDIIDVVVSDKSFKINEKVKIQLDRNLAVKAVFFAYIIPFFFIIFTLLIVLALTGNEMVAGLASVAVLIPYFMVLRILNKKIKKNYNFKLVKDTN